MLAQYERATGIDDVLANFQGPYALHRVMSSALNVPGNRLRLRTPKDFGGSFVIKQGVFPYLEIWAWRHSLDLEIVPCESLA
ncbi:molybdopterin-dependent oxidoreductase [Pseudomonas sp. REP124]|nr:molybdopterin-dependent oxidoreductase [Pseudomonas sp. REP124]